MLGKKKFVALREKMAIEQLGERGIYNQSVLAAMKSIPREKFVPQKYRDQAYEDYPLEIGRGQTVSQPYIVALMTQLLELGGEEKVLEIGTGSGYQAAVLGKLAREVYSLERDAVLAKKAKKLLQRLGFKNVKVVVGDGFLGYPKVAPYGAIILTAAPVRVPPALIEQLNEGGRLVVPLGEGPIQRLIRIRKIEGKIREEDFGGCVFVPMMKGVEK